MRNLPPPCDWHGIGCAPIIALFDRKLKPTCDGARFFGPSAGDTQLSWRLHWRDSHAACNHTPTDDDINQIMSGNICRCGTYVRIRAAIKQAATKLADERESQT
jgi:hypothetical protein